MHSVDMNIGLIDECNLDMKGVDSCVSSVTHSLTSKLLAPKRMLCL